MRDNITGGALTETMFLVLISTYSPKHGYSIMQFIEKETNGRVLLGAGTLYGAINTLLKKEWIAAFGDEVGGSKAVPKKVYRITEFGRQAAERELHRISEVSNLASKIIGGELI